MPSGTRILLAVGLGAALGSLARALTSLAMLELSDGDLFWGTLTVNVLGSFVIGLYATLTEPDGRLLVRPAVRQFVLTGFCGGFTTFSMFSLETVLLVERGALGLALATVGTSLVLWLAAVWMGYRLGRRLSQLGGSRP